MHHNSVLLLAGIVAATGIPPFSRADEAPDFRSVESDLRIPQITPGPAAAGRRIKEVVPSYADTKAYHVTYLPTDWRPGDRYPVIIEYAGNGPYRNQSGDLSTGRVEDSKLGYGISAGQRFVWVCLPYLNDAGDENVTLWWGNSPEHKARSTVEYCRQVVPWICEKYGGDRQRIVLTGFSRGAIACNFIGLYDSEVAKQWCAFVPFSHYDGVKDWGYAGSDRVAALERLKRLGNRPQFICAEESSGGHSVAATRSYLKSTGVRGAFTFRASGFRNHNDAWILRPSKARDELRRWLDTVVYPD